MQMKQIQFQVPQSVFDALKLEADRLGVTPGILARLKMGEIFLGNRWTQSAAESEAKSETEETDAEAYIPF